MHDWGTATAELDARREAAVRALVATLVPGAGEAAKGRAVQAAAAAAAAAPAGTSLDRVVHDAARAAAAREVPVNEAPSRSRRFRRAACEQVPVVLAARAAHELGAEDSARLDRHLGHCAVCTELATRFAAADHAFDDALRAPEAAVALPASWFDDRPAVEPEPVSAVAEPEPAVPEPEPVAPVTAVVTPPADPPAAAPPEDLTAEAWIVPAADTAAAAAPPAADDWLPPALDKREPVNGTPSPVVVRDERREVHAPTAPARPTLAVRRAARPVQVALGAAVLVGCIAVVAAAAGVFGSSEQPAKRHAAPTTPSADVQPTSAAPAQPALPQPKPVQKARPEAHRRKAAPHHRRRTPARTTAPAAAAAPVQRTPIVTPTAARPVVTPVTRPVTQQVSKPVARTPAPAARKPAASQPRRSTSTSSGASAGPSGAAPSGSAGRQPPSGQ